MIRRGDKVVVSDSGSVLLSNELDVGLPLRAGSWNMWTSVGDEGVSIVERERGVIGSGGSVSTLINWNQSSGISINSGSIEIGRLYKITDNSGGADFLNVGALSNSVGERFMATGSSPASWGTGSLFCRNDMYQSAAVHQPSLVFDSDRGCNILDFDFTRPHYFSGLQDISSLTVLVAGNFRSDVSGHFVGNDTLFWRSSNDQLFYNSSVTVDSMVTIGSQSYTDSLAILELGQSDISAFGFSGYSMAALSNNTVKYLGMGRVGLQYLEGEVGGIYITNIRMNAYQLNYMRMFFKKLLNF